MPFTGRNGFDANSQKVINVADPTNAQDAATKAYIDSRTLEAVATSSTTVGTSITALTGLSIASVPAGTYAIQGFLMCTTVGSPTAFTLTFSPSSGPTTTTLNISTLCAKIATTSSNA